MGAGGFGLAAETFWIEMAMPMSRLIAAISVTPLPKRPPTGSVMLGLNQCLFNG
jgi:hypothetical protein